MSRREFHLVEGTSSKFWAIELNGASHTVRFGRIGTGGQEQTKTFGSEAEARQSYEKLVAEKGKKGYREVVAAGPAGATPVVPATPHKPDSGGGEVDDHAEAAATPAAPVLRAGVAAEPAPATDHDTGRVIDLDPVDWHWATWRPRTRLVRPAAGPFDPDACAARLARVSTTSYGWQWDWERAQIPEGVSPPEAAFWLDAMAQADRTVKPRDLADELLKRHAKRPDPPDAGDVIERFKRAAPRAEPLVFRVLASLLPFERIVDLLLDKEIVDAGRSHAFGWQLGTVAVAGFRRHVLPYATAEQVAALRDRVRPELDPARWPTDPYERPPVAFHLAAASGVHDELLAVVRTWAPGAYDGSGWDHTYYHQPQGVVLGLGGAELVESEMRRLQLRLTRPDALRGWLANTEYAALDYARDSILSVTNKDECAALLEVLALVKAPGAAPHMLELKLSSKAPKVATRWLDQHVGRAVVGLVDAAAGGGRGRVADAAVEYLRDAKRRGHEALIRRAVGDAPGERVRREVLDFTETVHPPFDADTTPAWLRDAVADASGARPAKLPAWLGVDTLPPLVVGDRRLNDAQVTAVLSALRDSPLSQPAALLGGLRAHANAGSRDAFAWRLFELWTAEGAPPKEKWMMTALGHLGGDAAALRLTPLVRNWPGESQHQRAVLGLECLRAIGSDTALMCLNGIAQKLKFKGLKAKATEFMEAVAGDRNMSRADLEDRIVPDLDLDARGTRAFDFGPRQFRFVLGPEMKPMVKDADGRVKADLPAPGAKDDAAKAAAAVEAWKLLKKQVREAVKVQAERLEQAMVTGRQWTAAEFEALLVRHPLMVNLVRLLVWGGYDAAAGTLARTFRVTEDQTYADERDEACDLSGVERVGVVHPLHLSEAQQRAWGEVFGDYEIVPPFPQLGRPVYRLEKEEREAKEFTRFAGPKVPATALVGTLERLAWVRGTPQDAGVFYEHTKPFPGAGVTAVVQYDGVPVGYMEGWEDQQIERCFFVPGVYTPAMYPDHKDRLPLAEVDALAVSEVLKDLTLIASKAK